MRDLNRYSIEGYKPVYSYVCSSGIYVVPNQSDFRAGLKTTLGREMTEAEADAARSAHTRGLLILQKNYDTETGILLELNGFNLEAI